MSESEEISPQISPSSLEKIEKKAPPPNPQLDKILEGARSTEEQIDLVLGFMEQIIRQKGAPRFRLFWEAKHRCLDLFKQEILPSNRAPLWKRYVEISHEAKKVKELLEEQSEFAADQIEQAITALEEDVVHIEAKIKETEIFSVEECQNIFEDPERYRSLQKKLHWLNALASRIHDIRKELIRTEIRIKKKNPLFERLSVVGNHIFPERKEQIKELSHLFETDVEEFASTYFGENPRRASLAQLRDQIKTFQTFAKLLTLNTRTFNRTRLQLSQCWDKLNEKEKEYRKERAEQRHASKENRGLIEKEISAFKTSQEEGSLPSNRALEKLEEIQKKMRKTQLDRIDTKALQEELSLLKGPYLVALKKEEQKRRDEIQEERKKRDETIETIKKAIATLHNQAISLSLADLAMQTEELRKEIDLSPANNTEKQQMKRALKPIDELILEKREQELLSDDERHTLEKYREVLEERKKRRHQIKEQIEELRRASGTSGFDFEQAMNQQAQLAEEKERLVRVEEGIQEMEKKIHEIQLKQ